MVCWSRMVTLDNMLRYRYRAYVQTQMRSQGIGEVKKGLQCEDDIHGSRCQWA